MDFRISAQQLKLKHEIADFTHSRINTLDFIREKRPFNREEWKACGEIKLHGLPVSIESGGRGLDALSTVIALEELGYCCDDGGLPFAIAAQMLSCLVPLWKYGSQNQKEEYLPAMCKGDLLMANSITEAETGSDVFNMAGTASRVGDQYILNAEKMMITNAPIADTSLLYVSTDKEKAYFGGVTAFIVDHHLPGVLSTEELDKVGLESVLMGKQSFSKVEVDASKILGNPGSGGPLFQESMNWERSCLGAVHIGAMQKILDYILNFVKNRKVGEKNIGKYQTIAHKVADMRLSLETARMMLYRAAWEIDHTKNPALSASMSKLHISQSFQQFCLDAFSIMGGKAFLKGSFIEPFLRDSLAATIYSGTSEIQKNIIAGYLKI